MEMVGVMAMVSLTALFLLAAWVVEERRWRKRPGVPGPAARGPGGRAEARCALCHGPLPPGLITREEVIAQVERRIDHDSAAVATLLAQPPSDAWVNLFRP